MPTSIVTPSGHRSCNMTMKSLLAYLIFGFLHELTHVIFARLVGPNSSIFHESFTETDADASNRWATFIVSALLGRYVVVELDSEIDVFIVRHSAWIFSVVLAALLHYCNLKHRSADAAVRSKASFAKFPAIFYDPIVVLAAYITAVEAVTTDLLGFVPDSSHLLNREVTDEGGYQKLIYFCGNFGIILLNPLWINLDGGKKALDMLEKMVNVTMMRGLCFVHEMFLYFS